MPATAQSLFITDLACPANDSSLLLQAFLKIYFCS
jgi:hypothetical protein